MPTLNQERTPEDARFEFETIRMLSDSLRSNTSSVERMQTAIDRMQDSVNDMNTRLMRIELNKVDSRVETLENKVGVLEVEKTKRDGVAGFFEAVLKSPFAGWAVGAVTTVYLVISGRLLL